MVADHFFNDHFDKLVDAVLGVVFAVVSDHRFLEQAHHLLARDIPVRVEVIYVKANYSANKHLMSKQISANKQLMSKQITVPINILCQNKLQCK